MKNSRYQIIAQRYDNYFNKEKIVLYTGANREQMETLFEARAQKQGNSLINIQLIDMETGEVIAIYPRHQS